MGGEKIGGGESESDDHPHHDDDALASSAAAPHILQTRAELPSPPLLRESEFLGVREGERARERINLLSGKIIWNESTDPLSSTLLQSSPPKLIRLFSSRSAG